MGRLQEREDSAADLKRLEHSYSLLTPTCRHVTLTLIGSLNSVSEEIPEGKESSGIGANVPHLAPAHPGSDLTCVDLALIIHIHLQEPDEHAEEDPKELQIGACLSHLVEIVFNGKREGKEVSPLGSLLREP